MPSVKVHEEQSKHNYSFLQSINKEKYYDWKLTVAFYTALQAIDSGLTKKDPRWREKSTGNMYALRDKILAMWNRELYKHYSFLLFRSKETRYLESIGDKIAPQYFNSKQVELYIADHLIPILKFFSLI